MTALLALVHTPDLTLLRPWWLVALPVVAVLGVVFARRARGLAGWDRAIEPKMMAALVRLNRVVPGKARRAWLPVAIAAVLAVALVGPARRDSDPPTFRNLDGIVIAMDLSRSIAAGGSLVDAQSAAELILQRAGTRPAALIVYAGEAYLASAFTTDPRSLGTTIAVLDGETVPNPGSRADRALELAARTLQEASILDGDVVLITDGDRIGPAAIAAAAKLRDAGAHVSTLFVAPKARYGDMPAARPEDLKRLAETGGGFAGAAADPAPVADAIGSRAAEALTSGDYAVLYFTDYGRWLLILALLPALALFRRSV